MGIRPAMASIPSEEAMWKAPVIQRAALCCIFFSSYMLLAVGAPLKNHSCIRRPRGLTGMKPLP